MQDPSSLSNPQEVKASHLHLNVTVDFSRCTIAGTVEFDVEVQQDSARNFELDTRDLTITAASVDGKEAAFVLAGKSEPFGSSLSIPLPQPIQKKGGRAKVRVQYSTSPSSSACAWLPPPQTAGKKRPFLFTQCQAIHARSLLPCQDCPGTKCTWSAEVAAAPWATVLMSALQKKAGQQTSGGLLSWRYEQPVPTCTYLIALAVGELQGKDISGRCKVWAEPSMVAAAAWEFQDTEKFLSIAEKLTCPYQWTRYDVLCLPPSFPYGGMENPCLTFVTPTLLAGDRSLADVIAHEIAHSWTGNLVTNATWEHFWLNEGWTTWLQRRIMMHVEAERKGLSAPSKADFDFQAIGGWGALGATVARFSEAKQRALTKLVPSLDGVDPDQAFSLVPYEKGCSLLYALQTAVGDDAFLAFVKAYVAEFKSKLVTSESFRQFASAELGAKVADFPWDRWYYQEGMPPTSPAFDRSVVASIEDVCAGWTDPGSATSYVPSAQRVRPGSKPAAAADTEGVVEAGCVSVWRGWSSPQQQHLLDLLLEACTNHSGNNPAARPLPMSKLHTLDRLYGLTASQNCEIKFRWCTLCLRHGADFIFPAVTDMLASQGRMKYTRPLYRELTKFKAGKGKPLAVATFHRNCRFYHPICRKMVAIDLGAAAADGSWISWKGVLGTAGVVAGVYVAWAWWQVKNNRCPIPFHHLLVAKSK